MPSGSSYESYQRAFTEECEFLNFFETVFVAMVATIFADRHESEISRNSVGLSLFLPTESGAFLAEAYGPTLDIRTYLDVADLTVEQSAARAALLSIAMAFSRTPIHHYYSNIAGTGLLSLHANWSWELFRHCINHDAAAFIDAMFWTQDDWLSFNLKKTWNQNYGYEATVPADEILSVLNEGGFENSFKLTLRAHAHRKS